MKFEQTCTIAADPLKVWSFSARYGERQSLSARRREHDTA